MRNYKTCFEINVLISHFFEIKKLKDIERFRFFLKENNLKYSDFTIISGGSNIILSDKRKHNILQINLKGIEILSENKKGEIFLKVFAGENWSNLISFCLKNNFCGIENLSAIPGKVGACPVQNIGAYGSEVGDFIEYVEGVFLNTGNTEKKSRKDCLFSYRNSIFKSKNYKNKFLITSVVFKLKKSDKNFIPSFKIVQDFFVKKYNISQSDLKTFKVSIKEISKVITKIRSQKLPNPKKVYNVGSFFHNPIISERDFLRIQKLHKDSPVFQNIIENKVFYKIPAGFLLEKSGLKNFIWQNAQGKSVLKTYEKNALVLVNLGEATFSDLQDFVKFLQEKIKKEYKINLKIEPDLIF